MLVEDWPVFDSATACTPCYKKVTTEDTSTPSLKGIFSNFNNIFLGMNQKIWTKNVYFQNFSWFQFYIFKLYMIMCVSFLLSTCRLLCWTKSRAQDFLWKLLSFNTKMFSAQFLWRGVLLRGELGIYAKSTKFEHFENALYSTSGTMPLMHSL